MSAFPLALFLLQSEADDYLPAETKSPLFSIQREGLREDSRVLYRINRYVYGVWGTVDPLLQNIWLSE